MTPDQKFPGFLWSGGAFIMTPFNVPNALRTVPFGINDLGQIVGDYFDASGCCHGFLLSQGTYTKLDAPGSILTVAEGINNAGVIVGVYLDTNFSQHGFLLKNGVYTQVDVPGSTATEINSINARGQIAGYYCTTTCNQNPPHDDDDHGFVGTPDD